jgi:uncharacterized protein
MRLRILCVAPLAALLAACAAPAPTRFHTLLVPASTPAPANPAWAFELLPVSVPEQVDVPQLVVRSGAGELVPVDTRHWAAPLGRELRSALSDRLSAQLGVRDLHRLAQPRELPVWRISVSIARFDSVPGAYALLDAGWSIAGSGGPVLSCATRVQHGVAPGFDALVEGHQRAVAQLAQAIGGALQVLQSGAAASCPAT